MSSASIEEVSAVASTVVDSVPKHGNGDSVSPSRGRGGKRVSKRPASAVAESSTDASSSSSTSDSAPRAKSSRGRGKRLSVSSSTTALKSEEPKSSEPKPLPEHMDPPSQEAYKANLAKIEQKMKELTDKIDRLVLGLIPQKLDELGHARSAFHALLEKKHVVRASKESLFNEVAKHKAQIDNATGSHKLAKNKLQNLKKELKYDSVQKLDAAIHDLETKIQTSTMPLNAEKKCIDEVRRLRNQREAVAALEKESAEFKDTHVDTSDLKAAKKKANDHAQQFKLEEEKINKELDELKEKMTAADSAVKKYREEKDNLMEQRKAQNRELAGAHKNYEMSVREYERWQRSKANAAERAKRAAEKEERKKKHEEWVARKAEREKKHQEYLERQQKREERKKQWEERKKLEAEQQAQQELEWKAMQEQMKKEQEEEEERLEALKDPYEKEKEQCDEIIKYLKRMLGEKVEEKVDEKKNEVDGDRTLASAEDRLKDFKGKAVKAELVNKGKKGPEAAIFAQKRLQEKTKKEVKKPEKVTDRKLAHVPFTLASFRAIEIDPPQFLSQVQITLQKVTEKREYYNTAPRPEKKKKTVPTDADTTTAAETTSEAATAANPSAADEAEALAEEAAEREKNAAEATAAVEEERARRVAEDAAVLAAEKKEREHNRRQSASAEDLEQLRRVAEVAADKREAEKEESEERKKNQEVADAAFEKEKAERVQEEQQAKQTADAERVVNQKAADEAADNEQKRRIEEEKQKEEEVQEKKQKAKKLSMDVTNSDMAKKHAEEAQAANGSSAATADGASSSSSESS